VFFFAVVCPCTWLVYFVQELFDPSSQVERILDGIEFMASSLYSALCCIRDSLGPVVAHIGACLARVWTCIWTWTRDTFVWLLDACRLVLLWCFPPCCCCGRGWAKPCTGGRCNSCFLRALFPPCPVCKRGWSKPVTGMCNTCFRRSVFPPCPDCGRGWSKPGTGLCNTCFRARVRARLQDTGLWPN
jgi:hypothetical protein